MFENLAIIVGPLARSSVGSVTGTIYIMVGDHPYPEKGWNDFAVVVLAWWCEALCLLVGDEANTAQFAFMDGPFRLTLERDRSSRGAVTLTDERGARLGVAALDLVRRETLNAARLALEFCDAHSIRDADTAALRNHAAALIRACADVRLQ